MEMCRFNLKLLPGKAAPCLGYELQLLAQTGRWVLQPPRDGYRQTHNTTPGKGRVSVGEIYWAFYFLVSPLASQARRSRKEVNPTAYRFYPGRLYVRVLRLHVAGLSFLIEYRGTGDRLWGAGTPGCVANIVSALS